MLLDYGVVIHLLEYLERTLLHGVANRFGRANVRISLGHIINEAMYIVQTMIRLPGEPVTCEERGREGEREFSLC